MVRNGYRAKALAGVAACAIAAVPLAAGAQEVPEEVVTSSSLVASKSYSEDIDVTATNATSVSLNKDITVTKDIAIKGEIVIKGELIANESAMATAENVQINNDGQVIIEPGGAVTNDAIIGSNTLQNASGRIGLNVSSGDENLQSNATILSAIGAGAPAGASDGSIYSVQKGFFNEVLGGDQGTGGTVVNTTELLDSVLQGASGDVTLNVATGAFNIQANTLSVANVTGAALLAQGSTGILQESSFNVTQHFSTINSVILGGNVLANASGNISVNLTAGTNNIQNNSLSITSVQ